MYAPGCLGQVKSNFFVDTDCTHNLLSESTFNHLQDAVKEGLESTDTMAMFADSNELLVYGNIELTGRIRNSLFVMEFLVTGISNERILVMAVLVGQKCTLCLDKDVLTWRDDTIPLLYEEGRLLANEVQVLQPTPLPPYHLEWRRRSVED